MCIRHHTHWSVESVAERGAAAPFTVLSVWKRSSGCRNPNSVCLPRASRIRGTVRDGLKHVAAKPPLLSI